MRILYIITRGDAVGGASIHVKDLSRRLIADGHEVLVLVGLGQEVPDALTDAGVPFHQIESIERSVNPWRDLKALIAIVCEIESFMPELISCHTAKAGALGRIAARICGIPSVYSPHCWSFVDDFPKARLYLCLEKLLAWATNWLVAVSEHERQQGLSASVCTIKNSRTIHNGMPDTDYPLAKPENSPPKIIMVARIDSQKDHLTLIRALNKLTRLDWQLQLVGDGPLRASVETEVAQLKLQDRVQFMGYSKCVENQLHTAQLFVLSTNWESFPRSILEAMRTGLPVIASDVGGCHEAVLDGYNGFIIPANDIEALAEKLKILLEDPILRQVMGYKSKERYNAHFTFEQMYQQYQLFYHSLCA